MDARCLAVPLLEVPGAAHAVGVSAESTAELPVETKVAEGKQDVKNVIQFSAPVYYADRDQGGLKLNIVRIGDFKGVCKVQVSTEDGTATAGQDYINLSEELVFDDGEDMKSISIQIVNKDGFETTEEFKLLISEPVNCELGTFLRKARVKVLGSGAFPSENNADLLAQGKKGIDAIGGWTLLWEYVKWVMSYEGMLWRTALTLVIQQMPNVSTYAGLWTSMYIVDCLFSDECVPLVSAGPHEGRTHTGYIIGLIYILPPVLSHCGKIVDAYVDLEGYLCGELRKHMIRKFLNYSMENRLMLKTNTQIDFVMVARCNSVAKAYMLSLQVFFLLGKLLVITVFCVRKDPASARLSLAMPVIMLFYATLRAPILRNAKSKSTAAMRKTESDLLLIDRAFPIVEAYSKRPWVEDRILKEAKNVMMTKTDLKKVEVNNDFITNVLGPLFIIIHIMVNTEHVLDKEMPIGVFLATISVFNGLSELYADAYHVFLGMSSSHGAVKVLTQFLNTPTDVKDRQRINRQRRKGLFQARQAIIDERQAQGLENTDATPAIDLVEIKLVDLSYGWDDKELFKNVSITIAQGSSVCITGQSGSGKASLLKLLGNIVIPSSGSVFVPSHLRVVLVQVAAGHGVMAMSAWDNVTFGDSDAAPQRVVDIMLDTQMVKVLPVVLADLERAGRLEEVKLADMEEWKPKIAVARKQGATWSQGLSQSDACKIQIARALVMSPEVLVIENPCSMFNVEEQEVIMDCLMQFVTERGYQLPVEMKDFRRPRTLFFTSNSTDIVKYADVLWHVQDKGISQRLPHTFLHHSASLSFAGAPP